MVKKLLSYLNSHFSSKTQTISKNISNNADTAFIIQEIICY